MILHNATVDTILERRSVRSYAPQQITPDELETILEAGRSAPSGMNQQSAIAVAVQSKAELAQLAELAKAAAHQDHNPFYDAPTVILVFAKMTNLAPMEDGCTAIENMLLAAHSLGLGACWINQLKYCGDKAEVADYLEGLGIDKDMQVVGMVGMGYPDEEREAAKRQDDLVTYLN